MRFTVPVSGPYDIAYNFGNLTTVCREILVVQLVQSAHARDLFWNYVLIGSALYLVLFHWVLEILLTLLSGAVSARTTLEEIVRRNRKEEGKNEKEPQR